MKIKGNPDCQQCGLHSTAQVVCLMGRGPIPAKVMIVGEAPGLREDNVGKPFQGRAGQLLDKILGRAGLGREDVYVTNTVKCRPPDNRQPKPAEMKACRNYLDKEFDKVKPEFVILLGAAALKGVIGQTGITEKHGQVIEKDGVKYLPTFHPAAALYDPKRLGPIEQDIKKFAAVIKGEELKKPKLHITEVVDRSTYKQCIKSIQKSKWVSFDIETTGLDPRAEDAAVMTLQIGTRGEQFVLPLEVSWSVWKGGQAIQKNMLNGIVVAMKGKWVNAQNGKFDISYLWEHYRILFPLEFDTMVAAHILDENEPAGLKYRARMDVGAHDYDIDTGKKNRMMPTSKEEYYEYGCYDAFYTRKLAMLYHKRLAATDGLTELFYGLMMPATRALAKIENWGFYINRKQQAKIRLELQSKISTLQKELKKFGDINWGSPAQVGELMFGKLGLTPLEHTPNGAPSTAETVMLRLARLHPAPKLLMELRENQKLLSTYVGGHDEKGEPFGWESLMHGDYLYFNFKLTGTVTGRLSSRLHQVPRNPMIRSLIDAPEGWVFWAADFSQIELRLAAWFSNDRAMLKIYQEGGDIHWTTALETVALGGDHVKLAITTAEMYCVQEGLPADGTSSAILRDVWTHNQTGKVTGEILLACRENWSDKKTRRGKRGVLGWPSQPDVERWLSKLAGQKVSKEIMRAVWEYTTYLPSSQERESKGQEKIELSNALSLLSCIGPSIAQELRPEWKEIRKQAKAIGFGYVYGMQAKKFQVYARDNYGVDVTMSEATAYRNRYFNVYKDLLPWHERMRRLVRGTGQVRNPVGRIRRLPDITSEDWGRRTEAERQAINSPVQGFASDLKLMAMVELEEKLDEKECFQLGEHHDALLGMVRADKVDKWMTVVKRVMESPALLKKFNISIPVPIVAEVEIGPWGMGKKWSPKK